MPDQGDYAAERATLGTSGQMEQDIIALSNKAKEQAARIAATRRPAMEANAAQGLKAATGDGKMPLSLSDQAADRLIGALRQKELKDLDPTANRGEYMLTLGEKIVEMEKKAKDVEKSGTGNVVAMNAYTQVANILKQRLRNMQTEDVGGVATQPATTQPTPTSAPAEKPALGLAPPMTFGGYTGGR